MAATDKTTLEPPEVGSRWIYPSSGKIVTVLGVRKTSKGWMAWHDGRSLTGIYRTEWQKSLKPYTQDETA